MGFSKIVKLGPGKVKAVHQLNGDGTVYAEDIVIDATKAPAGRIAFLESQDGKVGIFSYNFMASDGSIEGVLFPEAD